MAVKLCQLKKKNVDLGCNAQSACVEEGKQQETWQLLIGLHTL